jgi:hypothetical protein
VHSLVITHLDYANSLLVGLKQKKVRLLLVNTGLSCPSHFPLCKIQRGFKIPPELTAESSLRSYSSSLTACKELHPSNIRRAFDSTSLVTSALASGLEALEFCLQPREEGRRRAPHKSRPTRRGLSQHMLRTTGTNYHLLSAPQPSN